MSKVGKPRKRGKRYEVNWIDGTGRRCFKTLPTHSAATKFLRARQAQADAVRVGAIEALQVDRTWPELVELWDEVKHAKRTLSDDQGRIRVHLNPALGSIKLVDITPRRISRLERDVGRRVSVGTVRQVLSLLRSMLRLAVEHGWLAKAPKIRLPKAQEKAYQWISLGPFAGGGDLRLCVPSWFTPTTTTKRAMKEEYIPDWLDRFAPAGGADWAMASRCILWDSRALVISAATP